MIAPGQLRRMIDDDFKAYNDINGTMSQSPLYVVLEIVGDTYACTDPEWFVLFNGFRTTWAESVILQDELISDVP